MQILKTFETQNKLTTSTEYHAIVKVNTMKRAVDEIDTAQMRPKNAPNHEWKAGYYGKICVATYASKEARDEGKPPIIVKVVYPTEILYEYDGKIEIDSLLIFEIDVTSTQSTTDQAYNYLKTLDYYKDGIDN
jgi:hypothetical protein